MNVVVITQEDRLYIPRNVEMICEEPGISVREIIVLDARGALDNMRGRLLRWFGPAGCARMGLRVARAAALDALSRATGDRLFRAPTSLRAVAGRHGIPFRVETDANAPELLRRLRGYDPDVVVSFSAPQVFREELLRLPRLGCLNLHCSLLPKYRGLLPSFWVLYHAEPASGATVHLMDCEIDNGGILRQVEVDIRGFRSMHQVLAATKRAGGELMLQTLREMRGGPVPVRENPTGEGAYFTWPTDEQARTFRRRGYRLA